MPVPRHCTPGRAPFPSCPALFQSSPFFSLYCHLPLPPCHPPPHFCLFTLQPPLSAYLKEGKRKHCDSQRAVGAKLGWVFHLDDDESDHQEEDCSDLQAAMQWKPLIGALEVTCDKGAHGAERKPGQDHDDAVGNRPIGGLGLRGALKVA